MNRGLFGLAAAGLALGLAACVSDPTDSLAGEPDRVVTSLSRVVLLPGDSALVTAELRDRQGATIPAPLPQATTGAAAIATVADASVPPLPQSQFYIKGVAPGVGSVTVTAASLSAEIVVLVVPPLFDGAVAVVSTGPLDTLVLTAGTFLGFDADLTEVLVDGDATLPVSRTPSEVKVLVPSAGPRTNLSVALENIVFLPGTENEVAVDERDVPATIDIVGEQNEPDNDDPATATTVLLNGTAAGMIGTADVDDYFELTLAAPTALEISVSFAGGGSDPDIDVYLLDDTAANFCDLDNCTMATGANPENTLTAVLPAGTYYIYVNLFDIGGATDPTWFRISVRAI